MRTKEHSSRPFKKYWRWLALLIILGIVLIGGYEYHAWQTAADKAVVGNKKLPTQLKEKRPFTVLVMGTDVGALGRGTSYAGNTDTMELMTVNPQRRAITMTAIPRDTLVKVNTSHGADYVKINASYAIGGAKLAQHQVSELLDVPVDYYALLNMGTLKKVVNAIGGVTVDNPFAFTYEGHHFKKGKQHLNGDEALKYSRMRYDDPNNDYGRQRRGQQVIESAITTFKKQGSLSDANELMASVADGVRTNFPINNVATIYLNYHGAMLPGTICRVRTPRSMALISKLPHPRRSHGYPTRSMQPWGNRRPERFTITKPPFITTRQPGTATIISHSPSHMVHSITFPAAVTDMTSLGFPLRILQAQLSHSQQK